MRGMRVSIAMITYNEAERLPATLASVAWADEVVVVDSGSTDATVAIARAAGARVEVEPFRGFGPQKDLAASLARNEWVFNLDADERPDARLADAIRALPAAPPRAVYAMRRCNRLAGRELRHWPWAAEWHPRVYDRRRARFGAQLIHEKVVADGPVGKLPGWLDHDSYRSQEDLERKLARYAQLWAEARPPRRVPALVRAAHAHAALLREVLLKGRLLGGAEGLRFARALAAYTDAKYRALDARARGGDARPSVP